MSKIISKPFNAANKILRAMFKGSPNLFTTSDLNRQIEAFHSRISALESRMNVGVVTDLTLGLSSEKVVVGYSYLEVHGCLLYSGSQIFYDTNKSASEISGVALWYTTKNVTYSDDATHIISGVKFEDGTSKAAADHLIIDKWGFTTKTGSVWDAVVEGATLIELCEITGVKDGVPTFRPYWAPKGVSFRAIIRDEIDDKMSFTTKKIDASELSSEFSGFIILSLNSREFRCRVNITASVPAGGTTGETAYSGAKSLRVNLNEYFREDDLEWLSENPDEETKGFLKYYRQFPTELQSASKGQHTYGEDGDKVYSYCTAELYKSSSGDLSNLSITTWYISLILGNLRANETSVTYRSELVVHR